VKDLDVSKESELANYTIWTHLADSQAMHSFDFGTVVNAARVIKVSCPFPNQSWWSGDRADSKGVVL
jgi:hypothetical protein